MTRNGFFFNTGFVGTSSDNKIWIRDLSGNVPSGGAGIIVTLTYYDAAGAATTVGPTTLTTLIQNNEQVEFTPAEIIAEMGATVPAASSARFAFAVQTTNGWAGDKKQVSGVGLDIQQRSTNGGDI